MQYYKGNVAETTEIIARLTKQTNVLALSRLAVFVVGGVAIFYVVQQEWILATLFSFVLTILAFVTLVYFQSKLDRTRTRFQAFLAVNQNEIELHAERSDKINRYGSGESYVNAEHAYVSDLDLFGKQSVFELINRAATKQGQDLLAQWLCIASDRITILQRQKAVAELVEDRAWCQEFQVDLLEQHHEKRDLKGVLEGYVGGRDLGKGFLRWKGYVALAPFLVFSGFLLALWWPAFASLSIWLMIAHLMISLAYGARVSQITQRADRVGVLLRGLSNAVARIEQRNWKTSVNQRLAGRLKSGDSLMSSVFDQLATILERFDYRLNMLVGALLNMVLLWDIRQVLALRRWKTNHGRHVMDAVSVIGEFEAQISLAILKINHPEWSIPDIAADQHHHLSFRDMSHPLISATQAVPNSFSREGHRITLITGSNMAGKSTFLRTVGVNMVLAFAGAPVCAKEMEVSVMPILTYMRIKDSLQESTSTFKAELNRMRLILETVQSQPESFVLIDEMLRGTNSVDKYKGSKAIIMRLIEEEVSGMVATHDLQLAELEERFPEAVRNYHFDIQVVDGEMLFDYKLKPGSCQVFNASILLKGIGIDVDPTSTST